MSPRLCRVRWAREPAWPLPQFCCPAPGLGMKCPRSEFTELTL